MKNREQVDFFGLLKMDTILNNKIVKTLFTNKYSLGLFIVVITIICFVFFLYGPIYDNSDESHFEKIGKGAVVASLLASASIYLYSYKGSENDYDTIGNYSLY
jgi:hypothetical protein